MNFLSTVPVCPTTDEALQQLQTLQNGGTVPPVDPACYGPQGGTILGDAGGALLDWALGDWIKDTRQGLGQTIKDSTTQWINTPSPSLADESGNSTEAVHFIQQSTAWYTATFLVISIVLAGIYIIWARRGDAVQNLIKLMVRFILVSAGATIVVSTMLLAADAFSTWIIDRSLEGSNFGENLYSFFTGENAVVSSVAIFGLMGLGLIVSGIQYFIMLGRGAALFVLVGTLPFAAAFALTESGEQAFKKQVSWIIAFTLYKPAAAIVYATGFRLMGASDTAAMSAQALAWHGIMLIGLAVLTLPAIMKLVTPAVNELTSGRGAGSSALGAGTAMLGAGMAAKRAMAGAGKP